MDRQTGKMVCIMKGILDGPGHQNTADITALQRVEKRLLCIPEPVKTDQLLIGQIERPGISGSGERILRQKGMVKQRMKSPILAGKITVKGFSGNLCLLAKIADGYFVIMHSVHHGQKLLLELTLTLGGLFWFAQLIHAAAS